MTMQHWLSKDWLSKDWVTCIVPNSSPQIDSGVSVSEEIKDIKRRLDKLEVTAHTGLIVIPTPDEIRTICGRRLDLVQK